MAEKRKRSPNWLASEKHLLLDIIQKHFNIIENKKTDAVTMKQKTAEWIIMSDEYNCQTMHSHRTAENIKAQWESMKKAVKKESSNIRMHLMQTGGGPPKPKTEDAFFNRILSLIEPSVIGLTNPFDNDGLYAGYESQNSASTMGIEEIKSNEVACVQVLEVVPPEPDHSPVPVALKEPDWGNYTHLLLQTTVSQNLKTEKLTPHKKGISKRRPILPVSSLDILHNKKIEAISAQREHASNERQEARSLFDINMEIKQLDLQIKKEELKQNKIKTKLLLLELRNAKKNGAI